MVEIALVTYGHNCLIWLLLEDQGIVVVGIKSHFFYVLHPCFVLELVWAEWSLEDFLRAVSDDIVSLLVILIDMLDKFVGALASFLASKLEHVWLRS